jgi:hypothetical protein
MSGITTEDLRAVAADLRGCLDRHDRICAELGHPGQGAERLYKEAKLKAHAKSTTMFGKQKTIAEHETAAELGSFDEWAVLNALQYERRALTERMHSLRQILSAYQTQLRNERELA